MRTRRDDGPRTSSLALPRRLEATVALLMVLTVLCFGCAATDDGREATVTSESLDDVHPWLLDGRVESPVDGLPTSYPYTIDTGNGETVTYDQGPTPGGYPWVVMFRHADGGIEIHELDGEGKVQARTYGSTRDP